MHWRVYCTEINSDALSVVTKSRTRRQKCLLFSINNTPHLKADGILHLRLLA